jgi:uncharacterized protein (DUF58 family)
MMDSNQSTLSKIPSCQPRPLSESSGYLFHKASLFVLSGFLLLSAWNDLFPLVILLGLILGAAVLAKIWARLSLVNVSCQRLIKVHRLFPGDQTELTLQVINRKPLPLPWVEIEDEVPRSLVNENLPTSSQRPDGCCLVRSSSLLWYRRARWKYMLHARKRGYYRLGPIRLRSGDLFGFYTRTMEFPFLTPIIVYPGIFPIDQLTIPSLFPLGDIRSETRIFQDPLRPIGLRDYQPCDNLRHIHWKASARSQKLQVKIFEPTTTLQASLFLAVDSFQSPGVFPEENFEWAISLAASVANHFIAQGIPTGLFVNTQMVDSGQAVQILPGGSRDQILMILEALAKVSPKPNEAFEKFFQRERRNLSQGNTLVFFLNKISESLSWQIRELKEAGYKVNVFLTSDQESSPLEEDLVRRYVRLPSNVPGLRSRSAA